MSDTTDGETQSDPLINLDGSEQVRELSLEMVRRAKRSIDIVGRQLDPRLYDTPEFVEAVRQFAIGSQYARVRLLAFEARQLVARGHQLINLAQQLPTFISIRVPSRLQLNFNEAILVVDERLWIHRRFADRFEGFASFEDPGQGRELARRFEELWNHADTDPNFSRLGL